MERLIRLVMAVHDLSEAEARDMVHTVLAYLKEELPENLLDHRHIDQLLEVYQYEPEEPDRPTSLEIFLGGLGRTLQN
jgi:hypothetical protein